MTPLVENYKPCAQCGDDIGYVHGCPLCEGTLCPSCCDPSDGADADEIARKGES